MHLIGLPDELLTQILGNDNEDVNRLDHHDYFNLSLASKRLQSLVIPLLHRSLDIQLGAYANAEPSKTQAFACERLLKEPELGSYVRKLKIECIHGQDNGGEGTCLDILRVTPNVGNLDLSHYRAFSKPFIERFTNLICTDLYANLTTLSLSSSPCACQIRRFFSIRGLKCLSLGYYSRYYEEDCKSDHSALVDPQSKDIGASSVSYLSLQSWQPMPSLSHILSLPRKLLKFEGCWNPPDITYSPLSVSKFLSPRKDTLEVLDITASVDRYDDYEPQVTDGTLANFAEFTALRDLRCDIDILLGDSMGVPEAGTLAERLPAQLETLTVRQLPRLISRYAHKPYSINSMTMLEKSLAFVRCLSCAAHQRQHPASLRSIILHESSYMPGPMEGPYMRPKLKHMQWRDDEKTAWCERGPFPLSEVGMNLTVHLVFVVRGWIHRPKGSEAIRKQEEKEARRVEELERGLNVDSKDGY
ncbi:hypothetical protein G7Y79_00004g012370 [Physcia stellaris]|nr:hypothetical protein G7Y79_00004g012370 [Physcia stellaris]